MEPHNQQTEAIVERRVFLVDDLTPVRWLVEEMLASIGNLRLVAVATGEPQAKAWMDQHRGEWDLTIVDLVLDEGTGLGVIRHAKTEHPGRKVAVLSAFLTDRVRHHCDTVGADAAFSRTQLPELALWLRNQTDSPRP
jgi:DNA-binding NarL/FixJ family response regulator